MARLACMSPWAGLKSLQASCVPDMVIQRILRHANVSTTTGYYIKKAADDVRAAMSKLESSIPQSESETVGRLDSIATRPM